MAWTYAGLRWFHGRAERTLVPTASMGRELADHGLDSVTVWSRGVDTEHFHPRKEDFYGLPRPIFLTVGRVAVEKNLEAFLRLDLPGSMVVVGDGPARRRLERRFQDVHWAGYRFGEDLARHYAAADVFVFPSRTDTFGVVMLEAAACGLPVAAYPVTGPVDVVVDGVTGILDEQLDGSCRRALDLDRAACRTHAEGFTWDRCAGQLLDVLEVFDRPM